MKKTFVLALGLATAAIAPVRADTYVLTANRIVAAMQGLNQLASYDKIVKDDKNHEQVVKQFYDISPEMRLVIAKDSYVLSEVLRTVQDAVRAAQQAAGKDSEKATADITALSERPQEVNIEPVDVAALSKVVPPIPSSVLAALIPISADSLSARKK